MRVNLDAFLSQLGASRSDSVRAKKPESHADAGDPGLWSFSDLEIALHLGGVEPVGGLEVLVLQPVLAVEVSAGPAELIQLPTIKNTTY